MKPVSEPRFIVGTTFTVKRPSGIKALVITDILKTYNTKGDLVKVRYVAQYSFCGQQVTDYDVCEVTVAKGLVE